MKERIEVAYDKEFDEILERLGLKADLMAGRTKCGLSMPWARAGVPLPQTHGRHSRSFFPASPSFPSPASRRVGHRPSLRKDSVAHQERKEIRDWKFENRSCKPSGKERGTEAAVEAIDGEIAAMQGAGGC